MINTESFLKKLKIYTNFFVGVPDSVLKNFTNLLNNSTKQHIIAQNEGSAISINSLTRPKSLIKIKNNFIK